MMPGFGNLPVEEAVRGLLKAVEDAKEEINTYGTIFERMESTLKSIIRITERIEGFDGVFGDSAEEAVRLIVDIKNGKVLVRHCSSVRRRLCPCCFKAPDCREDLTQLLNSVERLFSLIQARETSNALNITEEMTIPKFTDGDIHRKEKVKEIVFSRMSNKVPELVVGLDASPLMEIKEKLFEDHQSVIVLSAPGGYGKTTLAKIICQDEEVKGKFHDNILFVIVSKVTSLKAIIKQIYEQKGYEMPQLKTNEDAIKGLEQFLKEIGPKPILLVLDDVWSGSEALLENLNFQIDNYKIFVTSRFEFPKLGSTYKLQTLNAIDAMKLFRYSAFQCINENEKSFMQNADLENAAVTACKGVPLALTIVGKSFSGQPGAVWQKRVRVWSESSSGSSQNPDMTSCVVKRSLEALDNEVKDCYMDLGSFPEGQLIPVTALIDIWVELYELHDEDGENSISKLRRLTALDLINLVTRKDANEGDGTYSDHFIMQHDLLRDLVIDLSKLQPMELRKRLIVEINGNKFPEWWTEQVQQPISARLLSISTDESFLSNWSSVHAPETKVLILNFYGNSYTLPDFLENTDKLRALIVTNYSLLSAEIRNFQILSSLSKLKRIRLEKVSVSSLSLGSVLLKNLQKMTLVSCDISNSIINIADTMPRLAEINIDYCKEDLVTFLVGFCGAVHLKKLTITGCNGLTVLPKEIAALVNLEVLRLRSCSNLRELPETIGNLRKLSILDISYCSRIRKLPEQIGELVELRKMHISGCSFLKLPNSIRNLEQLKSVKCDPQTSGLFKYHLPDLIIKY
ncbi:probable disease resistance protein At5g66900 [Jatropha curcas]|uniref:JHL06P13.15 protein n=1 Tax=Jatropha curcas TaxID=180498 RepID=E6NUC4_JATCU|nr:probable disease resistance protein At5g66900 [Jatropha curcas]BAJ53234.1 JHL06P13.15 [Jatropha curcas]